MKSLSKEEKNELKRKAYELHKSGFSSQQIADKLGVSKTTAYSYVVSVANMEADQEQMTSDSNVPNVHLNDLNDSSENLNTENTNANNFQEERNELGIIKEELKNEFGTDKEIPALVDLKKAEMDYGLKLEQIDMERDKRSYEQRIKEKQLNTERLKERLNETETKLEKERQEKERLGSVAQELKEENEQLQNVVEELTTEPPFTDFDENLKYEITEHIREFIALENEITLVDDIEELLNTNKKLIKKTKKWCKKQNVDKSEYPEIKELEDMNVSILEMLEEFDIQNVDELTFSFDTDFEIQLKEKYS